MSIQSPQELLLHELHGIEDAESEASQALEEQMEEVENSKQQLASQSRSLSSQAKSEGNMAAAAKTITQPDATVASGRASLRMIGGPAAAPQPIRVQMSGRGLTNKEIATQLNLSEQTVKNHVHRMLRKVGATDRLGVLERCRTHGLSA